MLKIITKTTIILFMLNLYGCASSPKNTKELRSLFKEGGMFLTTETHIIKRPLKAVVKSFKQKAVPCFTGIKTGSSTVNGHYSTFHTSYLAVLKRERKNLFVFTIQDNISNATYIGGVPKGGSYNFLADIERINKSTTKITLNGISMKSTKYFDAILAWSKGKKAMCSL